MKNIHILPTDKPSKFCLKITDGFQGFDFHPYNERKLNTWFKPQNIYITSDEEIKEEDWCIVKNHNWNLPIQIDKVITNAVRFKTNQVIILDQPLDDCKKIILTTDQDLIKNGVQEIPDEFLEWFVKNPNCERVEVEKMFNIVQFTSREFIYKIIIPKEEPKFVTVNVESAKGEDLGTISYIPLPDVDYIPKQESTRLIGITIKQNNTTTKPTITMTETAVDYLFKKLWDTPKDKLTWYAILKEAKRIQKQQIVDACYEGMQAQGFDPNKGRCEQYYNSKYE